MVKEKFLLLISHGCLQWFLGFFFSATITFNLEFFSIFLFQLLPDLFFTTSTYLFNKLNILITIHMITTFTKIHKLCILYIENYLVGIIVMKGCLPHQIWHISSFSPTVVYEVIARVFPNTEVLSPISVF